MRDRKTPVLIASSVCAAVITLIALRWALWSTPPWPYFPPHNEANYPSYFVQARQELFVWSAPILCLSSAVAGAFLARSFYAGSPYLGRAAAVAMAWPALAFPFVGYFGLFALVFVPLAMVLGFAVAVRAVLEPNRVVDLWVLIPNGFWSVLLFVFYLKWDGVYGD
jgi:hypothetical protein